MRADVQLRWRYLPFYIVAAPFALVAWLLYHVVNAAIDLGDRFLP